MLRKAILPGVKLVASPSPLDGLICAEVGQAIRSGPVAKYPNVSGRFVADSETYLFADTVFKLYKGGYLRVVSVGFLPLEYRPRAEKVSGKARRRQQTHQTFRRDAQSAPRYHPRETMAI